MRGMCLLLFACSMLLRLAAGAQQLNGAGASFPNPIYSRWFAEYGASHAGVRINYQPAGSGAGIRQASERIVDFGATDMPMSDQQMGAARIKLFHIPTVMGAVVPIYNLPNIQTELKLTGSVIADMYLGRITNWNDKRIAAINPGVSLPDHMILPVYRSDGSGTTAIFTDFLSKSSPDFQSHVGKNTSVRWKIGIGQKGNEGVAGMVRQTPFSFGYVELVYALSNRMTFGRVQNTAGRFVKASSESVSAAAASIADRVPDDFRMSITNAPGAGAYPIASFTWLLIPLQSPDKAKGKVLKDFLEWMLQHGEAEASDLGYAPLPAPLAIKVKGALAYLR